MITTAQFISSMQFNETGGNALKCSDSNLFHVKCNQASGIPYFNESGGTLDAKTKITIGGKVFTGKDIKSLSIHLESGLMNDTLAIDTMTAEIKSTTAISVKRNSPVYITRSGVSQMVFYNATVRRIGKRLYSVYAESEISILDDSGYHVGGIYTGETAGTIVSQIMAGINYNIHPDIASIKMYGYLPYGSKRDNLRQVIIATGAAIRRTAAGVIDITTLTESTPATIGTNLEFLGGSVEELPAVTAVNVTEHDYVKTQEVIELLNDSFTDTRLITFSEPAHSLTCTGGTIQASGANFAKVKGNGQVTLTGKKYNHMTKVITRGTPKNTAEDRIIEVTDATLISKMNATRVAKRLYDYNKNNTYITAPFIFTNQKTGDIVNVAHPITGANVKSAINSLDIVFGNSAKATGKFLAGYTPVGVSTGYNNRVFFSSAGSWTVPTGITDILVIVIGGGDAGGRGGDGEDGGIGNNKGGKGGSGGIGGNSGKIIETQLTVNPGQSYSVTIGAGGTISSPTGGNTSFGSVSSAIGTSRESYVDAGSGVLLAVKGTDGIAGNDGEPTEKKSITFKGITYYNGKSGKTVTQSWDGHTYTGQGGYGGGAAVGENGYDGEDGKAYINGSEGGNGGNGGRYGRAYPEPPTGDNATIYGGGGHGGHGGGGGGAAGKGTNTERVFGGYGGYGSYGGNGKSGCVIIYY